MFIIFASMNLSSSAFQIWFVGKNLWLKSNISFNVSNHIHAIHMGNNFRMCMRSDFLNMLATDLCEVDSRSNLFAVSCKFTVTSQCLFFYWLVTWIKKIKAQPIIHWLIDSLAPNMRASRDELVTRYLKKKFTAINGIVVVEHYKISRFMAYWSHEK